VFAYCAWVFTLPLFPTQDGPVHLYYTWILSRLFSGSQFFSQYFSLRHPIPPYSVHYLLLFSLMKAFSPLLAEKIVVALILAGFSFSFRYLIRTVSPENGSVLALFAVPLSLTWALGMGFHNYCLSLALSFLAIAFWFRAAATDRVAYRLGFLLICLVMLFTHPVPLFMTLAVVAGDMLLRMVKLFYAAKGSVTSIWADAALRRDLICAALAFCSVAYIAIFVSGSRTSEDLHHKFIQGRMLLDFVKAKPLILVFGNIGSRLYRIFLFALLGASLWVIYRSLRRRLSSAGFTGLRSLDVLSVGAASILFLYPFIPRSINGSDFFADRLVIYVWMFAIAGASAGLTLRPAHLRLLTGVATIVAVGVLAFSDKELRTAAHNLEKIEHPTIMPPGHRGIYIDAPVEPATFFLNFSPYIWSSARYFRVTGSVMLNAPWLDLSILPLAPVNRLFTNLFQPKVVNYPDTFAELLLKSQRARDMIKSDLDFIIFVGYSGHDPNTVDNILKRRWSRTWDCRRDQWYAICSSPEQQSKLGNDPRF
jgi:hypothetical protein